MCECVFFQRSTSSFQRHQDNAGDNPLNKDALHIDELIVQTESGGAFLTEKGAKALCAVGL